jgi:hypothetical protein
MVKGVPARVCDQCGERTLPDRSFRIIEQIKDGKVPPLRLAPLRLYDFDEVATALQNPSPAITSSSSSFTLTGEGTAAAADPELRGSTANGHSPIRIASAV